MHASPLLFWNVSVPKDDKTNSKPALRERFWERYTLSELTMPEWEALCDGCGLCCLVKLEDEDTGEVAYTKVACKLLNTETAQCCDYTHRKEYVPDCLQLTPKLVPKLKWLPSSCAYKRVHEGKALKSWHPLLSGDPKSPRKARKSAAGRCISELMVDPETVDEYIVRWVR